jgi:replicative DNA helicase
MIDTAPAAPAQTITDLQAPARRPTPSAGSIKPDRLPPYSLEAEQCVLGCLLQAPAEGIGVCPDLFKAGAHVFYDLRHQTIFSVLLEMWERREPIDEITVGQRLRDRQQLDAIGGYAYLATIINAVPSAANLKYYADIIGEKYLLRHLIQTCTGFIGRAYEEQDNVASLLDEVERDVLRISEERENPAAQPIRELVTRAVTRIEDCFHRHGALTGLGTGFPDLDRITSGLHAGEMIVVAARPSMGKTSLAMNIAEHVAVELKQPVAIFSLEMTAESLVMRMLCSLSRVNLRSIREGFMSERDFPKLITATGKLSAAPLFIDDTPGLAILQLRARARRLWQQHHVKLFVVDYLQLLHSTAHRAEQNRQQEIADISGGIKALAKELGVPVLVLSQLNREVERDRSRKPRLSDLRESGTIEQDADLVGLLYRADASNPSKAASSDEDEDGGTESESLPVNLLVAKQRNGPTGDVHLTFRRSFTRFESASKVSDDAL